MQFQKIDKLSYRTNSWLHGESTELFLYPQQGSYEQRHFKWRISTATVTSNSSEFTALYGVKRWIMPYDATLLLKHSTDNKQLYSISLKPYQAHCFKGDWSTTSVGKTSDFNLMLKEDTFGILKPIKILASTTHELCDLFQEAFDERLPLDEHQLTLGFYSKNSDFELISRDETVTLECENLLLIHYTLEEIDLIKSYSITHKSQSASHIVMFSVSY